MFARGGMADFEFSRDQQAADAVFHQVAVHLGREVLARVLEPSENVQAVAICEGAK